MEYHDAYPLWASALCSLNPTENSSAIRAHSMTNDNRRILRPPPKEVACTTVGRVAKVRGPFCEGHTYFGPFFALWVLCGITLDGTSPSIRTPSGVFGCYPLVAFSCFKATKGVYVRRYAIHSSCWRCWGHSCVCGMGDVRAGAAL